jgi:hypothetical protein
MTKRAKSCLFSTKKDSKHYKEEYNKKEKVPTLEVEVLEVPKLPPEEKEQGEYGICSSDMLVLYVLIFCKPDHQYLISVFFMEEIKEGFQLRIFYKILTSKNPPKCKEIMRICALLTNFFPWT